ncbi:hypothetical protein D3C79_790230 [compost metagenome]
MRAVLRGQGNGIGHRPTQAQAGEQAQQRQAVQVLGKGGGQAEGTKAGHRKQQHAFAAKAVGQRPGHEGAEHQPDQCRAEHRAEFGSADLPVFTQRRGDETNGSRVQAVDGRDQKTQQQNTPLEAGDRLAVDEGLYIHGVVFVGGRHG